MLSEDSEIIIIGAGVFGLSTSLWLAHNGYKNVMVFDRGEFDKNNYNPQAGCDGASADINKIFRVAYGKRLEYQNAALEAKEIWLAWNQAIQTSSKSELPIGLTPADKLLDLCGVYYLADGPNMLSHYADSLETMQETAPQERELQFIKNDTDEEDRLRKVGPKWVDKLHVIDSLRDGDTNGFLDIGCGITIADKACTYARFLCEQAGVKFILGETRGKVKSLIKHVQNGEQRVAGINTYDGLKHMADLVIVACGAWTPSLIPEAHKSIEATAGTVMFIDVSEDRKDLRRKFHPDNFPVWHYRRVQNGQYYEGGGFPITKEGRLKFGFRGQKVTNFQNHATEDNLRVSTPRTKYSENPIATVPLENLKLMKDVIGQTFPELAEIGFTDSRLCWYTDTIDNEYLIDYVPGYSKSLFICTGGSGHGFKMLPILGKYVKNQLEEKPDQFTEYWKWRQMQDGQVCNGLEEGENGPRNMSRIQFAERADFSFDRKQELDEPSHGNLKGEVLQSRL